MEGVERGESTGEAKGEIKGEASSVATLPRASCKASENSRFTVLVTVLVVGWVVPHTHVLVVLPTQRRQVVVVMVFGELDMLLGWWVGFGFKGLTSKSLEKKVNQFSGSPKRCRHNIIYVYSISGYPR
jgi:hypothetical protein